MNIETVNELIASLESAGELSIREQKFLKLAKAHVQLAAENMAIREQSEEVYAAGYNHGHLNTVDGIAYADCVKDEFYSLALQVMAEVETPATDRIVAGIKADAIDEAAVELDRVDTVASTRVIGFKLREFSQQLREGADK
ncbi:TPA: hypothetical protein ACLKP2_000843 [Klebsiella pneumoniae]|nr:hypothetical protein [Klebsiella pneumoniae]